MVSKLSENVHSDILFYWEYQTETSQNYALNVFCMYFPQGKLCTLHKVHGFAKSPIRGNHGLSQ